jgi:hypothetical protein
VLPTWQLQWAGQGAVNLGMHLEYQQGSRPQPQRSSRVAHRGQQQGPFLL